MSCTILMSALAARGRGVRSASGQAAESGRAHDDTDDLSVGRLGLQGADVVDVGELFTRPPQHHPVI